VSTITAQGHPQTILRRALDTGNLVGAEIAAHQLGGLALRDALELTALVALRDRERGWRYAVRWLVRWLEERDATLDAAIVTVAALHALRGPGHQAALDYLRTV
jgi:hypothetical protein